MTKFMGETGPRSTHAQKESRSARKRKHIEKRKQEGYSKLLVYIELRKKYSLKIRHTKDNHPTK